MQSQLQELEDKLNADLNSDKLKQIEEMLSKNDNVNIVNNLSERVKVLEINADQDLMMN